MTDKPNPQKILLIHSETELASKIASQISSHLALIKRQFNYYVHSILSNKESNLEYYDTLEEYYCISNVDSATIVIILFDSELINNEHIMNVIFPYLVSINQLFKIVPIIISPIENPHLIPIFKFYSPFTNPDNSTSKIVKTDEDLVILAQFVRKYIESNQ